MIDEPREPTSDECNAQAQIADHEWAFWWPSMGGYVGRAVVRTAEGEDCVEVFVWHDGSFPFTGDDVLWPGEKPRSPTHLHMCSPDDFIRVGEFFNSLPEDDSE